MTILLKKINKNCCFVILVLCLYIPRISAGDIASYVDLGFSPDGKIYMFAQYGVQTGTLKPWADLFVVDVPQNNFVSGGRISFVHDTPVIAGQDGSGAFFRLISRNSALAERYEVNYLNQGHVLYLALEGNSSADAGETIEFRDFVTNSHYKAQLIPRIEGNGADITSSFHIAFEQTKIDGTKRSYTVGNPQIKRPLINSYQIRKVMVAPRDGSIVFVIEMRRQSNAGSIIRYMVEALRM